MYTNMTEDEKLSTIGKILETTTEKFTSAIDIIRPNIVIPVAGGYAIKGAMSETVNWLQIRRLNLMELVDHYQEHGKTGAKIIPLQHGMVVDVEKGEVVEGAYHVWSKEELSRHFAMVGKQEMQYAVNTSRKLPTMGKLIDRARKQLWEKQQQINIFVDYTVILDIEGEDQLIHIKLDEAETHHLSRDESLETPYLKMTLDQDTMLEWLLGFEDFNMLDSGHRISFHREPNDYVQEAYMLMSYFHLN